MTIDWVYCPECGSEETRHTEGQHNQCAICNQEWFSDIDYTHVVQENLSNVNARIRYSQSRALHDAASKFRGDIGYNPVAADGYSNAFDIAAELDFMANEIEQGKTP